MENKLRELQKIEFKILCDVVDLCEKHNIQYYLIGGTLLGAVRHKGFIPWDDDIDIAMQRKEYEKFLEVSKNELSKKYFVQNKLTDVIFSQSFTKIRKNGSLFLEKETEFSKIHKGIFIDIFPLDSIPSKDTIFMRIDYLIFKFLQLLVLYKNNYRGFRRKSINLLLFMFGWVPYKTINNISAHCMQRHNKYDYINVTSYNSGYGYKKQRMNRENIYGEGSKLIFEGREFTVPTKYIEYLEQLFGDYMKLPPKDKRHKHVDLEKVSFSTNGK